MELAPHSNVIPEHENEQARELLERGGPGIIVLGLPMRILYTNQRASDLIAHFPWDNHATDIPGAPKVFCLPHCLKCAPRSSAFLASERNARIGSVLR